MDFSVIKMALVGMGCLYMLTDFAFLFVSDGRVVLAKDFGLSQAELSEKQSTLMRWHTRIKWAAVVSLVILFLLRYIFRAI